MNNSSRNSVKTLLSLQKTISMKKLYILGLLIISGGLYAQEPEEYFEKCLSHKYIDYLDSKHDGFAELVDESFDFAKNASLKKTDEQYVIPVVVHVVYDSEEKNLPDSTIHKQIELLNADFQRQNADTINMRSDFDIVKGNPNIRFKLAQIDPEGGPTNGITRTETSITSFADFGLITGDFSSLERVKETNEGGHDAWDTEKYLNIWICDMSLFGSPVILGYASPPAGLPNWPPGSIPNIIDGVVVQYEAIGDNNPNELVMPGMGSSYALGRTLSHEVGHYLGLRHIWGDGDCTMDDGIDDTPNADSESEFDCDDSKNSCLDTIQGIDLPDMIENYMDYSAEDCQNTFTQGQVDLMRGVLENQRYDLVHDNPANVEEFAINIELYPNPVNETLTLKIEDAQAEFVNVYSIQGRKVLEQDISNSGGVSDIDFSSLENGVYMLNVINKGSVLSRERVVKK